MYAILELRSDALVCPRPDPTRDSERRVRKCKPNNTLVFILVPLPILGRVGYGYLAAPLASVCCSLYLRPRLWSP